MTGYDAGHAEGFIRLFGMPLAAASQRGPRKTPMPVSANGSAYAPPAANGTGVNGTNGAKANGTNGTVAKSAKPKPRATEVTHAG